MSIFIIIGGPKGHGHSVEKPAGTSELINRSFAVAARLGVVRCRRVFIVIGGPKRRRAAAPFALLSEIQ